MAVGLVVLVMVVVEASPAEATFPGNPGKIAYCAHHGQLLPFLGEQLVERLLAVPDLVKEWRRSAQ